MNFNAINPYQDLLIRTGLLEASPGTYTKYKTTPKGEKTLKKTKSDQKNNLRAFALG